MRWQPVVIAGLFTALVVMLIHFVHMDPIRVLGVLILAGLATPLAVAGIISLFLRPDQRRDFWGAISMTAKEDLREIYGPLVFAKDKGQPRRRLRCPNKTQTFAALAVGGSLHLILSKLPADPSMIPTIVGLHVAGIAALIYALFGLIKLVRDLF